MTFDMINNDRIKKLNILVTKIYSKKNTSTYISSLPSVIWFRLLLHCFLCCFQAAFLHFLEQYVTMLHRTQSFFPALLQPLLWHGMFLISSIANNADLAIVDDAVQQINQFFFQMFLPKNNLNFFFYWDVLLFFASKYFSTWQCYEKAVNKNNVFLFSYWFMVDNANNFFLNWLF